MYNQHKKSIWEHSNLIRKIQLIRNRWEFLQSDNGHLWKSTANKMVTTECFRNIQNKTGMAAFITSGLGGAIRKEKEKTKRLEQTKLFLFVVYAENSKESTKTYN